VLGTARRGATFLLNAPFAATEVWDHLPRRVQATILERDLDVWVVDAERVASECGLGRRINTVMQACFFAIASGVPMTRARQWLSASIDHAYGKRGDDVVERNIAAVDAAVDALEHVMVPSALTARESQHMTVPPEAPVFVRSVTAPLLEGHGDALPVSALPADGTFPTGTARYEKRGIAPTIPIWDPSICIDCGKCTIVCPHAAIRMKIYEPDALTDAPEGFPTKSFRSRELPDRWLTIQVSPDDCTGCGVCVEVCPAHAKDDANHFALALEPYAEHRGVEAVRWDFFLGLPELTPDVVAADNVKTSQLLPPRFEFSGACAGCGETPYLKLLTQLFGDRLVIANATGCSSIYGGNLPTTPWSTDKHGRGPAWANSLFEDNAEFGLGLKLAAEFREHSARALLEQLAPTVGKPFSAAILDADQSSEVGIHEQRERVERLLNVLLAHPSEDAMRLADVAHDLVRRSLWIVGGDGWAYDIGSGGVDHVLGSGRDVNLLVLDSQVYSNTGGQASKATPRGVVAKFAASGKRTAKKDLGLEAMSYGDVYVAQIALGGSDIQTVKALLEADAWPGPSLVIAYSSCVPAHGFAECDSMNRQRDAVHSGMWPLFRYRPAAGEDQHPFSLDSHAPTLTVRDFAAGEERFAMLGRSNPALADELLELAQDDVNERWHLYEQLAGIERSLHG
jgi:pyruvate-ferredoxin/flavodoxin oxidoreductase